MTKRRRQGEKSGYYTDSDGYKVDPKKARPPVSHRPSPAEYPTTDGGFGIMTHAVAQRWPITPEYRAEIVAEMLQIMREDEDPESRVKAARILVAAEKQNQDDVLKKQVSKISIEKFLQVNHDEAPPDYEYLQWKREKLMKRAVGEPSPSLQSRSDDHLPGMSDDQRALLRLAETASKTDGDGQHRP